MKKTKKYVCVSLALVAVMAVEVCALDPTAQSPIVSPIISPVALQSPYQQPAANTSNYDDRYRYSNLRNRLANSNLSRIQGARGFIPYNSIGNSSEINQLNSIRSLLRQAANPYYSNTQTSPSIGTLGLTGLDQTQSALNGRTDNYNLGAISDDLNIFNLRQQRPMASDIYDIEVSLDRNIKLLELRDQYGDLPLDQGILREPVRKANPDITDLLQIQQPLEPQQPEDIFEPKQKLSDVKDGDIYDSLINEMEPEQQEQLEQQDQPEQQTTKRKDNFDIPKKQPLPEPDHEKAAKIRGKHKTFDSLARANMADYIEIANKMLLAGKFYKAADACTLATVWMPEDAEPFLIKGLSLFAAGEYMSASFYIQQAIEMKKEYASEMIGLDEKLLDIDMIDSRLVEARGWQRQAKSPEIAFLMAFIYYQQGNAISAAEIMPKAVEKMGDNPAVKALQEAIEKANSY